MYYEINVSLNGIHFFATSRRSIVNRARLNEVYGIFEKKFPASEGYEIHVTKWEEIGEEIDMR